MSMINAVANIMAFCIYSQLNKIHSQPQVREEVREKNLEANSHHEAVIVFVLHSFRPFSCHSHFVFIQVVCEILQAYITDKCTRKGKKDTNKKNPHILSRFVNWHSVRPSTLEPSAT